MIWYQCACSGLISKTLKFLRPLDDNDIDWLKVGKYGMDYETILFPVIANKQEGQSAIIE